MAKHVYIIHAWDESPQSCWYPWLKEQLESRGFEVSVPVMPEPAAPNMEAWIGTLQKLVPNPDEQTYFVGHSIGCQTILRYLAKLPDGQRAGQAIFVAPWAHLVNLDKESQQIAKPWLETSLDWRAARAHCSNFTAFFSDDDQWVPVSEEQIFKDNLRADTRMFHQMKHFDSVDTLPEILEVVNA